MQGRQIVKLRYGDTGLALTLPEDVTVLKGQSPAALTDLPAQIRKALAAPIGCAPLVELLGARRPRSVAITISDITRPVPNQQFLPILLEVLNAAGIPDANIVIIIGTGMHRPSTAPERVHLVGAEILKRIEVIDHRAAAPETLVRVSADPPVSVCRRFAEADFRIVTGFIEPHFMAGFSGGRKGVCPALVDLQTVQRFHGYQTLANPAAADGVLQGNPCHEIALAVARTVGVDFLFNVAISEDRQIAGIYCGELEAAHAAGCRQVAAWTTARVESPFELVITNGGGAPLDQTFYQTVKGMCMALPALAAESTLLQVSHCGEGLGSAAYRDLMQRYAGNWQGFLRDIARPGAVTGLDQWELQMQSRVLALVGVERLWFVSDGIPPDMQQRLSVRALLGPGDARQRAQQAVDAFLAAHPGARVAVIPDGPYTMLASA